MLQSHVIEIAGTFVGAAVESAGQFRFVAVHPKVGDLNGSTWPSLHEIRRAAGHMMITGRSPATRAGLTEAELA